MDAVSDAGEDLAKTAEIKTSVASVLKQVEGPLGIDASDDSLVQFVPEGGSMSGVLNTLQPAINLGGPGHLPLHRHGATAAALVQTGEALAALDNNDAVVIVDDFGEDLDSISARHLASVFRQLAGQAWISTRRSAAIDGFPPEDIVRLHIKADVRRAAQIDSLATKAERVAARHLSLQLLPAASAAVVAIVEGPHDRAALDALALRLRQTRKVPLPAASGIAIIDAGVVDGSGGAPAVARLTALASRLGFHTIGVIDGDKGVDGKKYSEAVTVAANRVVRLPAGFAIERALTDGLDDAVVINTLKAVCAAFGVTPPADLGTQTDSALLKSVVAVLKNNGGLHAQFVELLPLKVIPPTLKAIIEAIVDSGENRLDGLCQL